MSTLIYHVQGLIIPVLGQQSYTETDYYHRNKYRHYFGILIEIIV